MKATITRKLFIIQFLFSLLLVSGMYLFVQWSFDRGFIRYVYERERELTSGLVSELATIHATDGGWQRLAAEPERWLRLLMSVVGRHPSEERLARWVERIREEGWPPAGHAPPVGLPQPLERRIRLYDAQKHVIYGSPQEPVSALELYPIRDAQEQTVGYLGMLKDGSEFSTARDLQFSQQQNQAFLVIALIMLLLSAAFAMPLSRHLVDPIRRLTQATRRLASGDYTPRIEPRADDELGQLARDFNELALTLSRNEQLRRQWVADISHELRTPLTILLGEIDAIRDGVYAFDESSLNSLRQEAQRLSRLVNDLYELSMSDIGALDYHKVSVDMGPLVADVLEGFLPAFAEESIRVDSEGLEEGGALVFADPERLAQLLGNLLSNSLRYTDASGYVRMRLHKKAEWVVLTLEDSAPGVAEAELPHLFDRLYRADSSRNRKSGGAGLGLAICQNIVTAHEGRLSVMPSALGGLCIKLELPLTEEVSA